MRLVAYGTDVSSIVEAGMEKTNDTIYTHKFVDSVEPLLKTGLIRSVLIVSKNRDSVFERMLEKYSISYTYKRVNTKWYEPFVSRHLLEPRVRDFDREKVVNEYPYVLLKEYKTLSILRKIISNHIPRRCGGFLFLYTKHRVPTVDFAILLHLKYGGHVCVSSQRDTGLAFACITTPGTGSQLFAMLRRETKILKFITENILTGFILSFPESPHVLVNDFMRILSEVEPKDKPVLPSSISKKFPFLEALLDNLSYRVFGKIKVRLYKDKIPYLESDGYEYILFHRLPTVLYTVKNGGGYTIYRVHLPVPGKIVLHTLNPSPKIVVDSKIVKPRKTEEVVRGYLHYLPGWVTKRLNKHVENMRSGLLAVFNRL